MPLEDAPFSTPWACKRRDIAWRFRPYCRATNGEQWSDRGNASRVVITVTFYKRRAMERDKHGITIWTRTSAARAPGGAEGKRCLQCKARHGFLYIFAE